MNPLLLIDGYKLDHRRQYPEGTRHVYSNWTPRGSRVSGQETVVFFGLQYLLEHYFIDEMTLNFFMRDKREVVAEYASFLREYLGPNDIGTSHIEALHDLGYVPLEFRALPEGTLCPLRVPMMTVENTHPDFAWLVNYFETLISNALWLPCTSATSAMRMRLLLNQFCRETGGDQSFVPWQGHDFSMRGMASIEAAKLSGAAHLLSFTGTDTIPAVPFANRFYRPEGQDDPGVVAGSVPATEHSVMSAGGEMSELETFERLLDLYPTGVVSIVSDTWNLWRVLTEIMPKLKDRIMARDGKVVLRPDSGDPVAIICGKGIPNNKPESKGVVELLWDVFGGTRTSKGYKLLDPHVGVIYGDAITYERCNAICKGLKSKGFASTNMVFGVGSYTYNYVTRDTYGFAMKATWANVNGEGRDLFKRPITDTGEKFSATGRLAVLPTASGMLRVKERATTDEEARSLLTPVWRNGRFLRYDSFAAVKHRLWGE